MSQNTTKKILVLGLDNAGKTSIVKLAVDKILTPLQVPTKGAERKEIDLLGQKVVVQDLGGQKKYRIQYMENPAFFDATDTLVFVVDLQDKDRYELAGEYFNDSLDMLDERGSPGQESMGSRATRNSPRYK